MKLRAVLITLLIFASSSGSAPAQSVLPQYPDVASVNKKPVDDAPVVFEGYIIRKIESNKFMFSDGTDDIRIEVDKELYPDVKVDPMVRVEIRGEIDKDEEDQPEIEVGMMRVLGE